MLFHLSAYNLHFTFRLYNIHVVLQHELTVVVNGRWSLNGFNAGGRLNRLDCIYTYILSQSCIITGSSRHSSQSSQSDMSKRLQIGYFQGKLHFVWQITKSLLKSVIRRCTKIFIWARPRRTLLACACGLERGDRLCGRKGVQVAHLTEAALNVLHVDLHTVLEGSVTNNFQICIA